MSLTSSEEVREAIEEISKPYATIISSKSIRLFRSIATAYANGELVPKYIIRCTECKMPIPEGYDNVRCVLPSCEGVYSAVELVAKPSVEEIAKLRKEGIEIKGATVKCKIPDDCKFPMCDCGELEETKHNYLSVYNRGYNEGIIAILNPNQSSMMITNPR